MIKKTFKTFVIAISLLFLFFFFFGNNVYNYKLTERKDLTIEQIERFEQSIKEGKEIDLDEYIVKEKDYTNIVTKTNCFISDLINKGFKKFFDYLLKNIDD